jgi:preprotein translocase subunit SecD
VSLRWRAIAVALLVVLATWLTLSNLVPEERRKEAWWLPDEGMRLGLDLQGGIHMVIGPDLETAVRHELSAIRASLEADLEKDGVTGTQLRVEGDALHVLPAAPTETERIRARLGKYETVRVATEPGGRGLVVRLTDRWLGEVRERAMLQALEVMRRRVEDPQTGIAESVVTRQGRDAILVQIPGVSRVPDIFRQTGFLAFKIVQDAAGSDELLRARHPQGLPEGTEIALEKDRQTGRVLAAYLVAQQPDITGDQLTDARVGFDNRRNEWQVNFTWSAEGGAHFAELTGANIGKPLAIILDGLVYSAPTIQDRISRQGVITGRFSSQEAADLAVILRAGALPIPVKIEEVRSIGPALGADSIRRGAYASIASLLVVFAFALVYYRLSGVYASIAVSLNLVFIVALMAMFRSTLTMPGIAGLVLTVGMAIDGNVLIFERIREELRRGRTPRAAIKAGFDKAILPILDGNITTLITAIVLYEYGSGPIKGFAVTLAIGLVTTVFTAVVVTRVLYALYPGERHVAELSI